MRGIISKLKNKKDAVTQWRTQVDNLKTNEKFKVNPCLPKFITTKNVGWYCHLDYYAKIRYDIIIGRYIIL